MRIAAALLAFMLALPAAASLFDRPVPAAQLARELGPMTRELQSAQTLRGSYVQHKTLRELARPLRSEGTFLFVRDRGIVWRTRLPFASEMVVSGEALIQRQDGQVRRIDAAAQPAVRLVGRIFMAVFALDFTELERLFELHGGLQADGTWALGLKPRSGGALAQIEVRGAAQVQRVTLRESGGDLTDIELTGLVADTTAPAAADLAPFSP